MRLLVAATFTAEPLERYLIPILGASNGLEVAFCPTNQLAQQLLDPASAWHRAESDHQVVLVRARDIAPEDPAMGLQAVEESLREARSSRQPLVLFCPHPEETEDEREQAREAIARLRAQGILAFPSTAITELLPPETAESAFDREADAVGQIAYKAPLYAAVALKIARQIDAQNRPPKKLIVVDADHTLWRGVLGEDGLEGIDVDAARRWLQTFLLERREAGFLLALSSKNELQDVQEALSKHPAMVLREDHFVSLRVNWRPKSENVAELCEDLGLGLDSVIFIDDNPAEVAEVKASCPQVTGVALPSEPGALVTTVAQMAAFDLGAPPTEEDRQRSELYRSQAERAASRKQSDSFRAFLADLQLEVGIAAISEADDDRVSQLSFRTNQFNAFKVPFSPETLSERRAAGDLALAVRAKDRFGDYGLVGAMLGRWANRVLEVDGFFLSCRALGKGVERHMIRALGELAKGENCETLRIRFQETERNSVCKAFLESVGGPLTAGFVSLCADRAARLDPLPEVEDAPTSKSSPIPVATPTATASLLERWADPQALAEHLEASRQPRPDLPEAPTTPRDAMDKRLLDLWEAVLGIEGIGIDDRFSALGGRSLQLVQMHARLTREFHVNLPLTDLFELPTVRALADRLGKKQANTEVPSPSTPHERLPSEPIAIVGMALRTPGADSVETFWENLRQGVDALTRLSDEDLARAGLDVQAVRQDEKYVPVKGCLEGVEAFDAGFFGILPKEAKHMDPQQRVFLELAWEALERAGYDPNAYAGRIGLWAGAYLDTYVIANLLTDKEFHAQWIPSIQVGSLQTELGNDKDYLATRVSFKLNLRGPSMTVQTACSTSMVAIAQAVQSLRAGESDMAMAGGVTITLPDRKGYYYTEDGMLSKDGRVCTFSDEASGTVFGNGAGLVVLKRLTDAQRDGDHIHAVIKGAALNNDGGVKHSYTAPSVEGQMDVITMAQRDAGVSPDTISYIEAHGTGTPLGDPIEVAALTKCFRRATDKKGYCVLGSLKPNVGHLDVASGVCGVIKTALALEKGEIPPLLHFKRPNPKIDFDSSPFRVETTLSKWECEGARRAAVSSFGVGGTNAHVVLEEPPEAVARRASPRAAHLVVLSARSESAREEASHRLANFAKVTDVSLADASFTAITGRRVFAKRLVCVARDWQHLREKLTSGKVVVGQGGNGNARLNFMFPGQGAQHVGMAREIYASEPVFRDHIDACAAYLQDALGGDLREVLYPEVSDEAATDRLKQTRYAQPSIFVIETGLAKLWQSWGLEPQAMIGHSVGEFAAACLAGVFTLEEGLDILATRGRLMSDLPGGAMLSVRLSEEAIAPYLGEADLAAVNGKELCVLAGSHEVIGKVEARLEGDGVTVKHLHTSHGFHSRMMDPVIDPFAEEIAKADLRAPNIPIYSTVTGTWLTDEEAQDPFYWARHLRQPVRFYQSIQALAGTEGEQLFLEVGPGQTLATLARQSVGREGGHQFFASGAHAAGGASDYEQLLETLGRFWIQGVALDWKAYFASEEVRRVPLPPYPFERKRHWVDPKPLSATAASSAPAPAALSQVALEAAEPIVLNPPTIPTMKRRDVLADKMREVLSELSDIPEEELDGSLSFLELGFDSLLLTQVGKAFQDAFTAKVTMRQLIDEFPTIDALTAHLDATLDPSILAPEESAPPAAPISEVAPVAARQSPPPVVAMPNPVAVPTPTIETSSLTGQVISQQMDLMRQQLALLQGSGPTPTSAPVPVVTTTPAPGPAPAATTSAPKTSVEPKPGSTAHGPYKPLNRTKDTGLSARQQQFIENLTKRYNEKTKSSKERTQKYRHCFADPRTANGFNRLWKDMCYQILVDRAKGSKLYDIDGNEYIDIVNGFGPNFLGHSPDFVLEALHDQLDKTIAVGPQAELAGETAELVCDLIGMDRVCFLNTGSEAVQAAMRVARTVTGRDKIIVFEKDYHGNFDEVLVRGANRNGKFKSMPIAPGIPRRAVADILVLPYGTDETLEIIRQQVDECAAVIVEPMQSRRPDFQPKAFIQEIRKMTENSECLFVFDEVITGFRTGPGGAQEYYGIKADLATYGKVIGSGMPVGLIAGKREYMDTFDGGQWQYGDDSFPEAPVTFFAGTFVRHPLTVAAVNATARFFKAQPRSFWDNVYAKAERMAGTIDRHFQEHGIGMHMAQFSSQMYLKVADDEKYAGLFFCLMRDKGIFMLEGLPNYLTASHTDEDIDAVIVAAKESAAEMMEAGFFANASQSGGEGLGKPLGLSQQTAVETISAAPLTAAQQEIWLACHLDHEASCGFNEATTLHVKGRLRVDVLESSLNDVIARHDALRATFDEEGREVRFAPVLTIDLPVKDLASLSSSEREEQLANFAQDEATRAFDLVNGPLIRGFVVRLGDEESILYLTAHHLVCDGWSYNVLLEELSALYGAKIRGEEPSLEPAPSFARYAIEKERLGTDREALAFWERLYADPPDPIALPTDRPYPAHDSHAGRSVRHAVSGALAKGLKRVGARQKCTAYQTLLGAFEVFLSKLTGQEDFAIGTPAAGQTLLQDDGMVGHCVHFLPFRSRVDPKKSFNDHLGEARLRVLEAFDHQDFTYGELLPKLNLQRLGGRKPLVEVQFNVERTDYHEEFHGLQTQFDAVPKRFVNFPLFFNVIDSKDGLIIDCDFQTDLVDAETVQGWLAKFESLMVKLADAPDQELGAQSLVDESEQALLLETFNGTAVGLPAAPLDSCVHTLFEAEAASHPEKIALRTDDAVMTYEALDRRANQFAQGLRARGVADGALIAVLLPRSFDLIASVLGILKAGGAYVPVDPNYPEDRVQYMLKDTQAPVLITTAEPRSRLAQVIPSEIDVLTPEDVDACSPDSLESRVSADDLAYVIYTSGSTGTPKGSMIPHRGVVRLVKGANYASFTADDVFLQAAAISFDASTMELWAPLLNGASLVLPEPGIPSLEELARLIREHGVTTLWLTSGLFQMMVEDHLPALSGLKQLLAGGDVLSQKHVALAFNELQGKLINGYGPTENTTFTCCHTITEEDLDRASIPIGKPIANTTVRILDRQQQLVPVGVWGELYIGGHGLAKGYLNSEELTREKFVRDPWSADAEAKLYRSGDRCRWLANGSIEFGGRLDQQVKIRGFRIEPGEVETALNALPEVAQSAVTTQGASAGTRTLVAYVVAKGGKTVDLSAMKEALAKRLPAHLVPSAMKVMASLPLTANGKVDFRALPKIDHSQTASGMPQAAPGTPCEKRLADLWEELLECKGVGLDDNFFEIGGHSLVGLKLFTQIQNEFGAKLPLGVLFEAPTVRSLAARIQEEAPAQEPHANGGSNGHANGNGNGKGNEVVPVSKPKPSSLSSLATIQTGCPGNTPIIAIHGGDGGILFYRELVRWLPKETPLHAIEAPMLLDSGRITDESTIAEIAAEYHELLLAARLEGPYILCGYSFGGVVAYEMAQRLYQRQVPVEKLILFDTPNPALELQNKYTLRQRAQLNWKFLENQPVGQRIGQFSKIMGKGVVSKVQHRREVRQAMRSLKKGQPVDDSMRVIQVREMHTRMIERYVPKPYPGAMILIRATGISDYCYYTQGLGWEDLVETLEVVDTPGSHLDIFAEPYVGPLGERFQKVLEMDMDAN